MTDRLHQLVHVAGEYKKLSDKLVWMPLDLMSLEPATRVFVDRILIPIGLRLDVAKQRLEGSVLIKLHDVLVQYLHHDPASRAHLWMNTSFESIKSDDAIAYLASQNWALGQRIKDGPIKLAMGVRHEDRS